ncbi:Na+/H+ antiporter NhaA [Actinomadura citrea]|uniref:Na+/H+ antiporter NhaA n=1 Tax=Actinomadura citrea TaxID=46158 RepID=UPI002E2BF15F|nr:Na+/H+ antiporter NhaA [Actinomadura citrea]
MTERRAGPPSGSFADRTAWARNLPTPLREFMRTETGGAVVLLAATLAALVWANADASSYERVWETQVSVRFGGTGLSQDLREWVNNGLMTVFFFVVGLEARREFDMGELRDRRRFALPLAAGVGGMVVPVAIYLAFNAGGPAAHGWGIAMSTDTAFALGVLALVGRTFPPRLRTYLLTATVVDDVIALAVIAIVYSGDVALPPLLLAVGIFAVTVLVRALGVRQIPVYVVLGVAAWAAVQSAGVEPVVVGLVMGLLTYAHPAARDDLERATEVFRLFREQPTPEFARSARTGVAAAISPNERLQLLIHPWTSYAVVPLFALANAGVTITAGFLGRAFTSTVTLGIVIGYVVGKPLGILGASWLVTRVSRGRLRPPVGWAAVGGGGAIAGIGFTVALLIATLSFTDARLEEAKIGVLSAALCATVVTWVVVRATALLPPRRRLRALLGTAESIIDLAAPVEPDRDHVRGPEKAPVTVVEYGDFECPYCGRAESVVRELLADYGDVRYVWRHLPLNDIHPQAQLAAEAAEAAAAQGRFWEMHDLLLDRQDALRPRDLVRYAGDIGLDVDRFRADLRRHTGAGRIAEDVDSADLSGVSGTPTFFVNGRRHVGAYDIATLSAAVRGARKRAAVGS